MARQLGQRIKPELARANGKAARQQRGDGVNIGLFDLAAAEPRCRKILRIDHEHVVNLIVSVGGIYRRGVNKQ